MNKSHQSCGINDLWNEGITWRIGGAIIKADNEQWAAWRWCNMEMNFYYRAEEYLSFYPEMALL